MRMRSASARAAATYKQTDSMVGTKASGSVYKQSSNTPGSSVTWKTGATP